ncbi:MULTISPECIES: NmrA family NAD(P)-binding protein [unclassified Neorhizobium]|uniref:NmrA family NAD(P)-binding protein n=1 Tax=unclassified Neorhizobium TaxID=2629175 RepID=UPI001FF26FAC|nr:MULTISPECIES: NmrA family NAD(P)-binding protein [unclassified Neorhizobium]MCJ9669091.1 NmrA family NAD(P)-binding protein [Neorhizobium sp. SHOUNA12B]MCJ9743128.1 NmrA family NAD(P)-binding protein [Neorhizobium sp. SHOUNA12A]
MSRVLVTGATGRLGRLIVERLVAQNRPVRILTRRPETARNLFGAIVQIAAGEFADRYSLDAALRGVGRLLLLSPISERLAADQIAVANAAEAAGVQRIVKISGSDWTIDPPGVSISGDAHAAVEQHLRRLPIDSISVRPNAWMQVSLANTIKHVLAGNPLTAANLDAGVGYIDARDIADVAVHLLLADRIADVGALNLSGPDVKTPRQIAGLIATALGRRVTAIEKRPGIGPSDTDFEHRAVAQFATLIAAGRAAVTTDLVASILGRPPRSVEAFVSDYLAAEAALVG